MAFLLRNSNSAGAADYGFSLGQSGDIAIAGDWNGDGRDTVGVFRPSTGMFYLSNSNDQGFADIAFSYGMSGDKPVAGDWNNDGIDTIGVFRSGTFYLRNANSAGFADLVFGFGNATGDLPVAGNWDGQPATLPPTATPSPTPNPGSPLNASFVYDGDGKRVKSSINGTTTYFAGTYFELTGATVTKYYYAGAQRIAMRTGVWDHSNPVTGTVNFLLSDHLGSTSLTTDANGQNAIETRYKAWGEVRYASGNMPTKYQYTGQYNDSYINLLDYGSRRYDPELGRFIQPDSIVPSATQGVQAWDRYGYANNNPVRFSDPSGHRICDYNCQIKYEGADPAYKHYGESLSCWGPTECWGVKPNTVVSKALAGDSSAIINAVLPTTGGVRGQLEIVPKEPICFFGVCVPVSVTLGLNIVANRIDGEISGSVDFSPELGPALQPDPLLPVDVSVTGGPMFTWFSSDAQQVTTGDSTVMSATVAAGEAYSAAIVTSPLGVPPDPMYGVKPVTLYAGVLGAGTGYASIGGGISHTLYETSFNFYGLFR